MAKNYKIPGRSWWPLAASDGKAIGQKWVFVYIREIRATVGPARAALGVNSEGQGRWQNAGLRTENSQIQRRLVPQSGSTTGQRVLQLCG